MKFEPMTNLGISRKDNPFWYKNFRDGYFAEVTDNKSNANLDIGEIVVTPPTEAQAVLGLVCSVDIKSNIGSIPCRVYPSRLDECIQLFVPEGILIDPRVAAQVLRHVETFRGEA